METSTALVASSAVAVLVVVLVAQLEGEEVERPLIPGIRFDVRSLTDVDALNDYRFTGHQIIRIAHALRLPECITTEARDCVNCYEALVMVLKRLAFPRRLSDLRKTFGRSNGVCYRVTLNVGTRLPSYKIAVTAASRNIVDGIALFIDGTKHFICRLSPRLDAPRGENLQKVAYSGHKRRHCLSYRGVIVPDGLSISFWGPVEGRRHDTTLLRQSGLLGYVETHPVLRQLRFNIYGDPAYSVSDLISVPYQGASLTQDMKACNALLSSLRVAEELGFNHIKRDFAHLEYVKAHKVRLSPVAVTVKCAVLFGNIHTCINKGNQISTMFQLKPPELEEYLLYICSVHGFIEILLRAGS
ncbi:hypothetical protein PHMEG_00012423 [Phytophthora megakarya]|uniref:DDE Tnp4 domain-containing protein n=1 Tax=Phytophthora megakarya TaxID=4795 RepID=A0A225W8S5_9STRA|nr:hypothetical protein PHMEG_00012423 [Phytophthora megakarya]